MESKASDMFWDILTSMKLFRCTCANILQIYQSADMRKGQGSIVDTKTLWAISIFEELLGTPNILSSSVFACESVSLVDTDSYLCQNSHVLEHQVRLANSLGVFFSHQYLESLHSRLLSSKRPFFLVAPRLDNASQRRSVPKQLSPFPPWAFE
jgi:hypothetical protein